MVRKEIKHKQYEASLKQQKKHQRIMKVTADLPSVFLGSSHLLALHYINPTDSKHTGKHCPSHSHKSWLMKTL